MSGPLPRRAWHRRKRTWAAVSLWLLVAYPLSYGPAYWLPWRYSVWQGGIADAIDLFYRPLHWVHLNGPIEVVRVLNWYVDLWSPFAGPPGAT